MYYYMYINTRAINITFMRSLYIMFICVHIFMIYTKIYHKEKNRTVYILRHLLVEGTAKGKGAGSRRRYTCKVWKSQ